MLSIGGAVLAPVGVGRDPGAHFAAVGATELTTLSETGFYFPGGFQMEFCKGRQRNGDSFAAPHPLRRFQIGPQRNREP
jgi:hypothetical protein